MTSYELSLQPSLPESPSRVQGADDAPLVLAVEARVVMEVVVVEHVQVRAVLVRAARGLLHLRAPVAPERRSHGDGGPVLPRPLPLVVLVARTDPVAQAVQALRVYVLHEVHEEGGVADLGHAGVV